MCYKFTFWVGSKNKMLQKFNGGNPRLKPVECIAQVMPQNTVLFFLENDGDEPVFRESLLQNGSLLQRPASCWKLVKGYISTDFVG